MPQTPRQRLTQRLSHRLTMAQRLLIAAVWAYRLTLARLLGGQCRFDPTCSQYAIDAVTKYGATIGGWRAVKRIARCHPWGGRGYDPV